MNNYSAMTAEEMEAEAPNLDGMMPEDLETWIAEHSRPRKAAVAIFGTASNGRTKAARDLYHYAWNKLTAMRCRLSGDVQAALNYETICDRIYDNLPGFARW